MNTGYLINRMYSEVTDRSVDLVYSKNEKDEVVNCRIMIYAAFDVSKDAGILIADVHVKDDERARELYLKCVSDEVDESDMTPLNLDARLTVVDYSFDDDKFSLSNGEIFLLIDAESFTSLIGESDEPDKFLNRKFDM